MSTYFREFKGPITPNLKNYRLNFATTVKGNEKERERNKKTKDGKATEEADGGDWDREE